jgi:hypothetical protein
MGNPFQDFDEFVATAKERCQFCGDVTHDGETLWLCLDDAKTKYGPRRETNTSEGRVGSSTGSTTSEAILPD